jgi:hypothetical protein
MSLRGQGLPHFHQEPGASSGMHPRNPEDRAGLWKNKQNKRHHMDIKTIWYEASPYLYISVGLLCLFASERLATFSGGLLILAALTILRLRWRYRRARVVQLEIDEDGKSASQAKPGKLPG